jgi:hypothetical protein
MTNHFHLLFWRRRKPTSLQACDGCSAPTPCASTTDVNSLDTSSGDATRVILVDGSGDGYLKTVCDYVHLNPVRAGLLGAEDCNVDVTLTERSRLSGVDSPNCANSSVTRSSHKPARFQRQRLASCQPISATGANIIIQAPAKSAHGNSRGSTCRTAAASPWGRAPMASRIKMCCCRAEGISDLTP